MQGTRRLSQNTPRPLTLRFARARGRACSVPYSHAADCLLPLECPEFSCLTGSVPAPRDTEDGCPHGVYSPPIRAVISKHLKSDSHKQAIDEYSSFLNLMSKGPKWK